MNNFIFTAIVVLAASKSKAQLKENQTNKERKERSRSNKIVTGKPN